ncbi:MAG: hypothetical protein ACOCP3_01060 [Halodesulfurarchaeum sp.]
MEPTPPLASFQANARLVEDLRKTGWRLTRTHAGRVRIVLIPHLARAILERFLADLDRGG